MHEATLWMEPNFFGVWPKNCIWVVLFFSTTENKNLDLTKRRQCKKNCLPVKVLTTFTKQFCCMTMFPVWTPSIGMLDQCKYWEENSFCLPCSSLYLGLVSAHFTFHSMMFEWGKIWRKGWSKIIAETKPNYGLYKKEAGVGSSPSIASLSNIDIYTIWGMMGKPISRGGGLFGGGQNNILDITVCFF